jgi:hypothetical protein
MPLLADSAAAVVNRYYMLKTIAAIGLFWCSVLNFGFSSLSLLFIIYYHFLLFPLWFTGFQKTYLLSYAVKFKVVRGFFFSESKFS